ncbi:MAG TPA: AraC family transcriptional regulator [Gammaproteobacteria bacterium]|nr:AraC family transcriptional regulator [Gammaproteobacteria bacterium]
MRKPYTKGLSTLPSCMGSMTRLAFDQAKQSGIDVAAMLKAVNISSHQIANTEERIKVRDQIQFVNMAAGALQDEFLGFHLAQTVDLREVGLLYYVSASSSTLSEALRRASRYSRIVNEGLSLKYSEVGDVKLKFHYFGVSRHHDRHQMEWFMALVVRLCRHLTGLRIVPSCVKLMHRRSSYSELAESFGCDVEFGVDGDELTWQLAARNLPVVGADHHLNRLLIKYCEEALSRRPSTYGSFRASVENEIVPLLPHGRARTGEIARRLGVSRRTLTRCLAAEGVTFSVVLESLRGDLARRYLAEKQLSISKTAWLLGYREVSAFTHAFKRWAGQTPRQARSDGAFSLKREGASH